MAEQRGWGLVPPRAHMHYCRVCSASACLAFPLAQPLLLACWLLLLHHYGHHYALAASTSGGDPHGRGDAVYRGDQAAALAPFAWRNDQKSAGRPPLRRSLTACSSPFSRRTTSCATPTDEVFTTW